MTKEQFITNEVARALENGGYKVDINLINRCWDTARKEQIEKTCKYLKNEFEGGNYVQDWQLEDFRKAMEE